MTKLGGYTAGAAVAGIIAAGLMASVGAGIARADDYSGHTYGDVSSALSKAGLKGVVVSRVGDELPEKKCTVTHSQQAAWVKGDHFKPVANTVLLDLNCDADVATAGTPGYSAASPEGRQALAAEKNEATRHPAKG